VGPAVTCSGRGRGSIEQGGDLGRVGSHGRGVALLARLGPEAVGALAASRAAEEPTAPGTRPAKVGAQSCLLGGETQIFSIVRGVVVTACLRGPETAAHEAEVPGVIAALEPAS